MCNIFRIYYCFEDEERDEYIFVIQFANKKGKKDKLNLEFKIRPRGKVVNRLSLPKEIQISLKRYLVLRETNKIMMR